MMLKQLLPVSVAAALILSPVSATATVLTFDDLNTGDVGAVPSSYAGLTFNGWWHIDNPPYDYPYASAPTIIYNAESPYTNVPEIASSSPIDVLSVYLADYNSGSVDLFGYLGSTLLYSSTITLDASMTQFALNFNGIDRFVMQTPGDFTYAFLDNFEFQRSVPEPASLALVGLGLAGMVFSRRRTKA